ncbi:MAG: hypothetical protein WA652_10960, partial [Xanthobacteraceae bacterium]
PSNLIITGRYILQPQIFDLLGVQKRGAGEEIQLTDAMATLRGLQPFYGLQFAGRSFDCGSKIGFLAANIAYALARTDLAPSVREILRKFADIDSSDHDRRAAETATTVQAAAIDRAAALDLIER